KAVEYAKRLGALGDGDIQTILLKRGCLVKDGDTLSPTNAGILLFGKDPQRFVQGSEITAVRFAGETMSDTFSRQDITGTLPEQIRKAETFLIDYLRKDVMLKDRMAREENYEYPLEAVRELVVNAVAHRAYHISGDGIRLYIFSNRLEINSPGGLPGPVTVNNIKDERFSRNPAIVQVLSDMGFIERLGYGVDRVIELMREHGLQAPSFEDRASGFKVVLYNTAAEPENLPLQTQPAAKQEEAILAFNGIYNGQEINPRQEAALVHLHQAVNQRITNREFQQLCPDVHAETIRRDLVDLVNKGILKKLGQKRGSYYVLAQTATETEQNAE
ncbi:MAG: transcriptional regulator, partial [Chloroflexi bacterium]